MTSLSSQGVIAIAVIIVLIFGFGSGYLLLKSGNVASNNYKGGTLKKHKKSKNIKYQYF